MCGYTIRSLGVGWDDKTLIALRVIQESSLNNTLVQQNNRSLWYMMFTCSRHQNIHRFNLHQSGTWKRKGWQTFIPKMCGKLFWHRFLVSEHVILLDVFFSPTYINWYMITAYEEPADVPWIPVKFSIENTLQSQLFFSVISPSNCW